MGPAFRSHLYNTPSATFRRAALERLRASCGHCLHCPLPFPNHGPRLQGSLHTD